MPTMPQFPEFLSMIADHDDDGLFVFVPLLEGFHNSANLPVNVVQGVEIRAFQGLSSGG